MSEPCTPSEGGGWLCTGRPWQGWGGGESWPSFLGLFAQVLIKQELCVDTGATAGNDTDKHPCLGKTD